MAKTVTIFGTGYVGLVTGACLADIGHQVLCVDIDADKIDALNRSEIPIFEPGLDSVVLRNQREGRLRFSTDLDQAVAFGEYLFIAVGTPPRDDGGADLSQVRAVARAIGKRMAHPCIVVNKSTVPVGTAHFVQREIAAALAQRGAHCEIQVCSNPEFLKEGDAVNDFMKPDRIVIGSSSDTVIQRMRELYAPLSRKQDKIMVMDEVSAEMTKYAANAMLATKVSFMNDMANLAEQLGADIEAVRRGIGADPRIGYHFIFPGCGYGGSCFPKDVRALNHTANAVQYRSRLLSAIDAINNDQKQLLFRKLWQHFKGRLAGKTIALWGLAFKPNTDDMREAPSRVLMEALWLAGATVRVFDPAAMDECRRLYPAAAIDYAADYLQALDGADALVLCTEWSLFRSPCFTTIKQRLKQPVVVDGRNLWEPRDMAALGFSYYAVGRPSYPPRRELEREPGRLSLRLVDSKEATESAVYD